MKIAIVEHCFRDHLANAVRGYPSEYSNSYQVGRGRDRGEKGISRLDMNEVRTQIEEEITGTHLWIEPSKMGCFHPCAQMPLCYIQDQ